MAWGKLAGVALVAVVGTAGSCGSEATGRVYGTIMQTGGPPGARETAGAGKVTVKRAGWRIDLQRIGAGQQFSFDLPPGRYTISADDGGPLCADADVTVAAGDSQSVDIVCQRK